MNDGPIDIDAIMERFRASEADDRVVDRIDQYVYRIITGWYADPSVSTVLTVNGIDLGEPMEYQLSSELAAALKDLASGEEPS